MSRQGTPVDTQEEPQPLRPMSRLWRDGLVVGGLLTLVVVGGVVLGRFTVPAVALRYVLALGTVTILVAAHRIFSGIPAAEESSSGDSRGWRGSKPVEQFRNLVRYLRLSFLSAGDAQSRLGPIVREIVALRLLREHGLEITSDAAEVRAVLGNGKIAELLQLEGRFAGDEGQGAWTRQDLEKLVGELERLGRLEKLEKLERP
ncbi:MAG: hypothetical protein N3B14_07510 [Thermoleophilia bacterium]|nr:hypothetical protein [Thermoleophilia bacterium]